MGYLLMSYQMRASEWLSDEQWLELTSLASKYDFSAPRLRNLARREETDLTDEEAYGLHAAFSAHYLRRNLASTPRPRTSHSIERWCDASPTCSASTGASYFGECRTSVS